MRASKRKHRPRNLDLDLNCHACGFRFAQIVGWKVKHVYCPICNSQEVHVYEPREIEKVDAASNKVIPLEIAMVQEQILAIK